MCGLFGYFGKATEEEKLVHYFNKIQHRGPDKSEFKKVNDTTYLGFHRLAINGLNEASGQPMYFDGVWLVANAEIFNYKELAKKYQITLTTGSDCEIIIKLYQQIGLEALLPELDGEYAFIIYDENNNLISAARDHLGIRGFYMSTSDDSGDLGFASEAKALTFCDTVKQFPPASYWTSENPDVFLPHYFHDYPYHLDQDEETHCQQINKLLEEAVKKRLMSERPVACLLSGGLDSSLVAALAAKHYTLDEKIKTFSVGMPGSPDLAAAAEVAEHIGSEHYHVELTQQDFLDVLEETIFMLGSFDVTTIRASVGHMLISRYVRDHSDVKVLFSGETADEFGSYLYFQNAPCQESFQNEAVRLLEDIQYFDMKRGDRSISYAGLEARVPFADKAFVKYYMGIKPELRMFNEDKIEKYLIRKAFQKEGLLPESVLWRRKNGFSDSVSMKEKSWSTIIQEYVDMLVTDTEYESQKSQYEHDTPKTKEAYYYRKIFTKYYGKHQNLTPYQWLPKWCGDVVDPSARVLKIYAAD